MKKTLLPLLLALSLPALADPIDDFAQAELERQKIPGLAVGIYRNGNIVKQQGYGLANVETPNPRLRRHRVSDGLHRQKCSPPPP